MNRDLNTFPTSTKKVAEPLIHGGVGESITDGRRALSRCSRRRCCGRTDVREALPKGSIKLVGGLLGVSSRGQSANPVEKEKRKWASSGKDESIQCVFLTDCETFGMFVKKELSQSSINGTIL